MKSLLRFFDRIEITLDDRYYEKGKFVIQTYHNSAGNCYIRQARLNGKPLHDFRFSHADFSKGGLLELWMGPEPAKKNGEFSPKTQSSTSESKIGTFQFSHKKQMFIILK